MKPTRNCVCDIYPCRHLKPEEKSLMLEGINVKIKKLDNTNGVSDGCHTFGELYEHRFTLFIALAKKEGKYWERVVETSFDRCPYVWRSMKHSDDTAWDGWFILGIGKDHGDQITYHLPMSKWDETEFAETLKKAPKFDGHTSEDVLNRLKQL